MSFAVNSLWVGEDTLPPLQQLTIATYLKHGHSFRLWTYRQRLKKVPPGTEVMDAAKILPRHHRFKLQGGTHSGSWAFFADWFQMNYLYQHGGWWTHLDVLCLQPLDRLSILPYVFAPHYETMVAAYLMKAPADNPVCRMYVDRFPRAINRYSYGWHDSMNLMRDCVKDARVEKCIVKDGSLPNDNNYGNYHHPFYNPLWDPPRTIVHHWCGSLIDQHARRMVMSSWFVKQLREHRLL